MRVVIQNIVARDDDKEREKLDAYRTRVREGLHVRVRSTDRWDHGCSTFPHIVGPGSEVEAREQYSVGCLIGEKHTCIICEARSAATDAACNTLYYISGSIEPGSRFPDRRFVSTRFVTPASVGLSLMEASNAQTDTHLQSACNSSQARDSDAYGTSATRADPCSVCLTSTHNCGECVKPPITAGDTHRSGRDGRIDV